MFDSVKPLYVLSLCVPLLACSAIEPQNTLLGLVAGLVAGDDCGGTYLESIGEEFSFDTNDVAGETTGLEFTMSTTDQPMLETRTLLIQLPEEVGFMGFYAIGGIGVEIGTLDFDTGNPDGVVDDPPDATRSIVSIFRDQAYVDIDDNGQFDSGIDFEVFHSLIPGLYRQVGFYMPYGGTPATMNCYSTAADFRLDFFDGIFVLPDQPGDYVASIQGISIDPDTGDTTDFQGTPPTVQTRDVMLTVVPEPTSATAALVVALLSSGCASVSRRRRDVLSEATRGSGRDWRGMSRRQTT